MADDAVGLPVFLVGAPAALHELRQVQLYAVHFLVDLQPDPLLQRTRHFVAFLLLLAAFVNSLAFQQLQGLLRVLQLFLLDVPDLQDSVPDFPCILSLVQVAIHLLHKQSRDRAVVFGLKGTVDFAAALGIAVSAAGLEGVMELALGREAAMNLSQWAMDFKSSKL